MLVGWRAILNSKTQRHPISSRRIKRHRAKVVTFSRCAFSFHLVLAFAVNMPPSPHDHSEMLAHHDVNDETVQTGRSRKRRKAPMVYDKSGLTKQQRRDTRMQQRSLYETLETATAPDHLDSISEQNNAIFRTSVKFSREAVLDAENVFKIAQKYEQYAESLVQVRVRNGDKAEVRC
jgi:hypothetical protein